MPSKQSVFILDDDAAFLDSMSALVSSMGFAAKCFGSGAEFLGNYQVHQPGCLLLDLKIPDIDGFDVLKSLSALPISPPVIVLTANGSVRAAVRAVRQGVVAFLEKQSLTEAALLDAIQKAHARDRKQRAAHKYRLQIRARFELLTAPESIVLNLLLRGQEQSAIAEALGISRRTVDNRRQRLMKKLEVATLPDLVQLAVEAGLLER